MSQTFAMLRLCLTRGLGLRSSLAVLRRFKTPEHVLDCRRRDLEACGIPGVVADDLLSSRSADRAEAELKRAERSGVRIVDLLHDGYPPLLREIFDPPAVLYIKGSRSPSDLPQVAVVGTRRPTGYGIGCAERLAEDLAARGLGIVSGLARGIDAAAHRGALKTGSTFAVFGCGLDFVYPKENRKLAEKVTENGALLSEFPLGMPPAPHNFPIRNRIIAGLSLGVLVIEAADCSGSLITARLAIESNRDVFAVPGSVLSPQSTGPHILIRQGAKLAASWEDVVEELPQPVRERLLLPVPGPPIEISLSPDERLVWDLLSAGEPVSIDRILAKLPLAAPGVYSALLSLETSNRIRQLPGNKYIRCA